MERLAAQEIYLLMAIGVVIMLALAIAFVLLDGRSRRRLLLQKMEGQALLLRKTILAQEEERNRIAQDLHDEIGSKLNVIYLHLQRLKSLSADLPMRQATLQDLTEITNTVIGTTRRISHELLPPTLEEFGLTAALRELGDTYARTGSLEVQVDAPNEERFLKDKLVELHLFRILQELINNSVRHGQAKRVRIRLEPGADGLVIAYEDDGKGFDPREVRRNKGLGMKNIESRVQIIGGQWTYRSSPGYGLQVKLTLKP